MSRFTSRSGVLAVLMMSYFLVMPVSVKCEGAASGSGKMELADAIAKRQEEIKQVEADIKKLEANKEVLLKEARGIQTQIKRTGIKDEAKASTRALETTREMYAKTREYNNLQQTLDDQNNKAFADYCIAKGYWLIDEKKKKEWDASDEAAKLRKTQKEKQDGAYDKWKAEMDNLAKNGSKGFGIDPSVVEEQNQKQQDNLDAFKKNDEELDKLNKRLEELKKMSDHDYQREQEKPKEPAEDDDQKPDHEFFFFSTAEKMYKDTHLKLNEMKNVEFSIGGGVPPYTLTTSSVNSEDNRSVTIAKRPGMGEHYSFPISFSKAGTRSMEFTLADSDGRRKSVTVVFYVEEDDTKKDDDELKKLQDEEYKKALAQARTLITNGHNSEASAQGILAKAANALNAAQEAEVKANGFAETSKLISEKVQQMNTLASQATGLASGVLGASISTEGVAQSAYENVVSSRNTACGLSANIKQSPTPEADAEKASAAADDAELAAAEVEGDGKTAAGIYQSAKASYDQLMKIKQSMADLEVELAGLTAKVSELPGIISAANDQISSASGGSAEVSKFTAEVESAKSGALGILNLYSDKSEAQVLIGQANTLGSSLKSEKNADTMIQEAQGIMARLQKGPGNSASPTIPAFPGNTSDLYDKVEALRTSADTIELFESRCQTEASLARTCADTAKGIAESMKSAANNPPQGTQEPGGNSGEPPSWWSPTGQSVSGPSVPNSQSQQASNNSANKQIEQGNQMPPLSMNPQTPVDTSGQSGPGGHNQPQPQNSGVSTPQTGHYPGDADGCT